jgi:riboflavin biosynthesis pyrimidine reductase
MAHLRERGGPLDHPDRAAVRPHSGLDAPATEIVTDLKGSGTGDILVNTSQGILGPLLAAGLVDRLYLMIFPERLATRSALGGEAAPARVPTCWSRSSPSPSPPS